MNQHGAKAKFLSVFQRHGLKQNDSLEIRWLASGAFSPGGLQNCTFASANVW